MDDAFLSQLEDAYDNRKPAEIARLVNSIGDDEWYFDESPLRVTLCPRPFCITVELRDRGKREESARWVDIRKEGDRYSYPLKLNPSDLPMPKKIIDELVALADGLSSFPSNGEQELEEDTSYHGEDIVTGF